MESMKNTMKMVNYYQRVLIVMGKEMVYGTIFIQMELLTELVLISMIKKMVFGKFLIMIPRKSQK